jgi:hypothetical protein
LAKQDPSAALETIQQAANLTPADKQDSDPEWQQILALRARIELAQLNYAASAADAQMAVERAQREAIDPKSSAWVGEALVLRARSEAASGNTAAAAASARQALPHLQQNLDPSHPLLGEASKLASGTRLASGAKHASGT